MVANRELSLVVTLLSVTAAGAVFVLALTALLNALGWSEATLAQISIGAPGWRADPSCGFVVPLVAASTCALLVGSIIGLMLASTKWLSVLFFFIAFFFTFALAFETTSLCCSVSQISKAHVLGHFILVTPFMWLFPLLTCSVAQLIANVKSRLVTMS